MPDLPPRLSWDRGKWPTSVGWALLIAIALLNALASYGLIRAVAEAGAVQPYSDTALVWVTILGLVVFGDFPDEWTILATAVIVASSLYTWHHDRRSPVGT